MDRFLEKFNLPRLNQEEIEIMNNPVISTEIEAMIKRKSPKTQKPRTRWLHRRFLSNIYRRANSYPSKTLSKNCRRRNTSKLWGHHHPDTNNRHRQHRKTKLQANITDEHRGKNLQQNFTKQFSNTSKSSYTMIQLGLFQGCKDSSIDVNQSMWYTILTNEKINAMW